MTMLAGLRHYRAFVIYSKENISLKGLFILPNRQSLAGLWLPLETTVCRGFYGPPVESYWVRNRIAAKFAMESAAWLQAQLFATSFALGPAAVAKRWW